MENDGDHFAPGGAGFCLAWPPAAKVATRASARATLENFTRAIPLISGANNGTNNGWENDNGGGLEDIGAVSAAHRAHSRAQRRMRATRPSILKPTMHSQIFRIVAICLYDCIARRPDVSRLHTGHK